MEGGLQLIIREELGVDPPSVHLEPKFSLLRWKLPDKLENKKHCL